MRKGLLIFLVVAVLCGAIAGSVMAYGNGPGRPGAQLQDRLAVILKLTPDQEQKISAIRKSFIKDTLESRQALQDKMKEMRQLWAKNPLDQDLINSKTKEINDIRVQLVTKSRDMQEQIKKVLTSDQLKKLDKLETYRMKHFQGAGFNRKGMRNDMRQRTQGSCRGFGPQLWNWNVSKATQ